MAGLLRQYFKDIRRLGRPSDFLVLIAGSIIFAIGLLVSLLDFVELQRSIWRANLSPVAGLTLLVLGTALRVEARRTLSRYWSPVARVLPDHRLVTYGVYKHIRHPGYLGELLMFFAIPLLLNSAYGVLVMVLVCPFVLYRIRVEEKMMLEKFGDEYRRYVTSTKKLIPQIY